MVCVYVIPINDVQISAEQAYQGLTLLEQQAADRLTDVLRRRVYSISHYMLRRLLSEVAGCELEQIQYQYGVQGKPECVDIPLYFNLSHSADMAVVAISEQGPVGIDVEYCRPRDNLLGIARRFFAPLEVEYIESASDQTSAFYQVWTAKEACLKAQGLGISSGLDGFSVVDAESGVLAAQVGAWVLHEMDVTRDYQCCLFSSALYNSTERILIKSV